MDHSLQSYLERRSNEELKLILRTAPASEDLDFHQEIIAMVLKILHQRESDQKTPE